MEAFAFAIFFITIVSLGKWYDSTRNQPQLSLIDKPAQSETDYRVDGFRVIENKDQVVIYPPEGETFKELTYLKGGESKNLDRSLSLLAEKYSYSCTMKLMGWDLQAPTEDHEVWFTPWVTTQIDLLNRFFITPEMLAIQTNGEQGVGTALKLARHFLYGDVIEASMDNLKGNAKQQGLGAKLLRRYLDKEQRLEKCAPYLQRVAPKNLYSTIQLLGLDTVTTLRPMIQEDTPRAVIIAQGMSTSSDLVVQNLLREVFKLENPTGGTLSAALEGLGYWGTSDDEELVLQSEAMTSQGLFPYTVNALVKVGSTASQPWLLRYLDSRFRVGDSEQLAITLLALKKVGDVEAIEPLLQLEEYGPKTLRDQTRRTIEAIQARIGPVEAGWLSMEKTAEHGGLSMSQDHLKGGLTSSEDAGPPPIPE